MNRIVGSLSFALRSRASNAVKVANILFCCAFGKRFTRIDANLVETALNLITVAVNLPLGKHEIFVVVFAGFFLLSLRNFVEKLRNRSSENIQQLRKLKAPMGKALREKLQLSGNPRKI